MSVAEDEAVLSRLLEFEGVTHINLRAGQVLLYRHHMAKGLFIIVRGAVAGDRSMGQTKNASEAAFTVPELEFFDEPAHETISITQDAEIYYVPRTLMMKHREDIVSVLHELAIA